VVVEAGMSVTEEPMSDPGIQLYVEAPLAVSVVEDPEQTVAGAAVAVTFGNGFTVTVTVAVLKQPGPFVPVTVYVVVLDGERTTEDPVKLPGIQL
jgi:hypothetical protein